MPAHVFLAHFPLVLLLVAAVIDLLGALAGRADYRRWAGALLILGALAAFLSFVTGANAVYSVLGRPHADPAAMEVHTRWGAAGVWLLVGSGVLRVLWRERLQGAHGWILLGASVLSAVVAYAISASGFAISHGG